MRERSQYGFGGGVGGVTGAPNVGAPGPFVGDVPNPEDGDVPNPEVGGPIPELFPAAEPNPVAPPPINAPFAYNCSIRGS